MEEGQGCGVALHAAVYGSSYSSELDVVDDFKYSVGIYDVCSMFCTDHHAAVTDFIDHAAVPFAELRMASIAFSLKTACRNPAPSSFFEIYRRPSSFDKPSMW